MNRNRFVSPPLPYSNDIPINSINYAPNIPRFNVWQSSLSSPPNMQQTYPQVKKNYCSTCDMWTSEPYNNHQISPAHLAKKAGQRGNQNYQPSYSNTNSSSSITSMNNNNSNANTNKKKFKRSNKRNRNKQTAANNVDSSASNVNDGVKQDANNTSDDKNDEKTESRSKESDKNLSINKHRGQEMLIPVNGVFCALCEIFFPSKDVAEKDHCSSLAHCEAYEKLLKRVQESKLEKRSFEKSVEDKVDDCKRLKSSENQDRDFRIISSINNSNDDGKQSDQNNDNNLQSVKESEEIDRNSTNEFNAPDFSLDFPDDLEDYDEIDLQNNSKISTENRKLEPIVNEKDI